MAHSLKHGKVRRMIDLDESVVKWYEGAYGEGRFSWIMNQLLTQFKTQHQYTPQQLGEAGAAELKRLILSGQVEPEKSIDSVLADIVEEVESGDTGAQET